MKVLVTGGAGFIGSHVVEAYLGAGHQVVAVDDLSSGRRENVPSGARFVLMDVGCGEFDTLLRLEQPEMVNHLAAQVSVTVSTQDPSQDARVNALGFLSVLKAAVHNGVRKVVFSSTGGAIYGETDERPTPESFPPQPISPYGIHKHLGEQYLRFFSLQHGLDYTILRYANVYGPRQNAHGEAGVVAIFIDRLRNGQTPTIYTYPEAEERDGMGRDYVYVQDVARANLLAAAAEASGEVVNIGTGVETTTGALYRQIAALFPDAPEPERGDARPGDLRHSCLDVRKARSVLGWQPAVGLKEGLAKTVAYFA